MINLACPLLPFTGSASWRRAKRPGLRRSSGQFDQIFAAIPKVKSRIALGRPPRARAHRSGTRSSTFAAIIAQVREPERLGVCLDTAHVFAAGLTSHTTEGGTRKMLRDFDRVIGMERLVALHLE